MAINPANFAKSGTEDGHQTAVFAWAGEFGNKNPEFKADLRWMHAIPNGGSRGDDAKTRAIRGGKLKATGVKTGVYDIFLPLRRGPYCGLYIEMKRPELKPKNPESKGGRSDEQIEFGAYVRTQGFGSVVCYGWEEAVKVIEQYLRFSS